jgi:site-specific recombinase XerD
LANDKSKSSVKQSLAAIRMLFDWLIVGQVWSINPAHAVRGPKLVVKKGKSPILSDDQVLRVFAVMVCQSTVGLREALVIRGEGYCMKDNNGD